MAAPPATATEALPVVDAPLDELRSGDFAPFTALAEMPLGMTAHVVYSALDPTRPPPSRGPCSAMSFAA